MENDGVGVADGLKMVIIHPNFPFYIFNFQLILSSADADDVGDGQDLGPDGFQVGYALDLEADSEDASVGEGVVLGGDLTDGELGAVDDIQNVHGQTVVGKGLDFQNGVEGLVLFLCPVAADPAGGVDGMGAVGGVGAVTAMDGNAETLGDRKSVV